MVGSVVGPIWKSVSRSCVDVSELGAEFDDATLAGRYGWLICGTCDGVPCKGKHLRNC